MSPLFSWIEVVGYLAAAATLLTFHSRTMIRLRWFAIAANVLFIGYGAAGGYYPVLFLHIVLLPLNIVRLRNMQHMTRQIERATLDEFNIDWLRPYMQSRGYKAGQFVFRKGDPAEEAFYVTSGELETHGTRHRSPRECTRRRDGDLHAQQRPHPIAPVHHRCRNALHQLR